MERVYKSRCDQGGARRGNDTIVLVDNTIVLGGIRIWEEEKPTVRLTSIYNPQS
jgi:hypothetical protein